MDQFNQLCALHEKEPPQETTPVDVIDTPSISNVAGIFCVSSCVSKDTWVIDSGASDHMCNSLHHLHNVCFIQGSSHEITIPDGSKVKVTQLGGLYTLDTTHTYATSKYSCQ